MPRDEWHLPMALLGLCLVLVLMWLAGCSADAGNSWHQVAAYPDAPEGTQCWAYRVAGSGHVRGVVCEVPR